MKVRNKTIVPRNPYAVLASSKLAGAHVKSKKAIRKKEKMNLKKELKNYKDGSLVQIYCACCSCFTSTSC